MNAPEAKIEYSLRAKVALAPTLACSGHQVFANFARHGGESAMGSREKTSQAPIPLASVRSQPEIRAGHQFD